MAPWLIYSYDHWPKEGLPRTTNLKKNYTHELRSSRDTVWAVFAIWSWPTETYYPNGAAQKAIGRCGVRNLKGRGLPEPCGRCPSRSSPSPGLSKVSESSALRQPPQTLNVNQRHRLPGPTPTYVETNMFNSPRGGRRGQGWRCLHIRKILRSARRSSTAPAGPPSYLRRHDASQLCQAAPACPWPWSHHGHDGGEKQRSSQYNRNSIVAVIIRTHVLQKILNRKRWAQ